MSLYVYIYIYIYIYMYIHTPLSRRHPERPTMRSSKNMPCSRTNA